jgi:hypothetical protein
MNHFKLHDKYLKPMELMSDFFDRTTERMQRGEKIDDEELDNEVLKIAKVLLRNPRLNDNVTYGPMLQPDNMLAAEIPEIPEPEQEPIMLEVRNNASFEQPMGPGTLELSGSTGVSSNPIDLSISPRNSMEESWYGGLAVEEAGPEGEKLREYGPYDNIPRKAQDEMSFVNRLREEIGKQPFRTIHEFIHYNNSMQLQMDNDLGPYSPSEKPKPAPKRKKHDIF